MNASTQRLIAAVAFAAAFCVPAGRLAAQPTPESMIAHMDADGDGRVSKDEFTGRRRPFEDFDLDGDGYATRDEIEAAFGTRRGMTPDSAAGQHGGGGAPGALSGRATLRELDTITRGAFLAKRVREDEIARGLIESNLIPEYPGDASCPRIDHIFGEPWQGPVSQRKSNATRHHGADIPATRGTPILAMANGVVVAKSGGKNGDFRGKQITLRHSPQESGLSVWLYTTYAHFSKMPEARIGQHVRMGEPLGPTGKSGVSSLRRQEHLHVEVLYSTSDRYVATQYGIVPVDGRYADVVALMRARMPLDTNAMRALPDAERHITIPHKLTGGATVPSDALIIWPYACESD